MKIVEPPKNICCELCGTIITDITENDIKVVFKTDGILQYKIAYVYCPICNHKIILNKIRL